VLPYQQEAWNFIYNTSFSWPDKQSVTFKFGRKKLAILFRFNIKSEERATLLWTCIHSTTDNFDYNAESLSLYLFCLLADIFTSLLDLELFAR
jgi:hypothetical protein